MLSFPIPPGTTPRSLLLDVLPREHARLVPGKTGDGDHAVVVRLGPGAPFVLSVRGSHLTVREGESAPGTREALTLSVAAATLQVFLDDWSGPGRWLPKFEPQGGVGIPTDPRLLRRVAMARGAIELAIVDFEGGRAVMTVSTGAPSRAGAPDVVIEATTHTLERLLAGTLAPDEALADGQVTVRGKMLVAMQFALAVAPFFPVKPAPRRP